MGKRTTVNNVRNNATTIEFVKPKSTNWAKQYKFLKISVIIEYVHSYTYSLYLLDY